MFTTDLADLSDRQLVIEAVVEDEAVKGKIFAQLDELITDPDAVLASNTSSIPIMKIAAATKNPSRVLGLHFFNRYRCCRSSSSSTPWSPLKTPSPGWSSSPLRCSERRWCAAATAPGSSSTPCWCPTCCRPSAWLRPGGSPASRTSTRQSSRAIPPDGPLRLSDLIGLDTMKLIADSMYDELKDAHYAPPPLLLRMVEAGQLGKKSGQGSTATERAAAPAACAFPSLIG